MRRPPALLLLVLAACTGTETGTPSARARLGLEAETTMPDVVSLRAGAGVVVTEARATVASVDFRGHASCAETSDGLDLESVGPIDFFDPAANVQDFDLDEGAYCRVLVRLEPAAEGARDALVVRGTRADGTPFEWLHDGPSTLDLAAGDALFLHGPDAHDAYILGLDLAALFRGADLGTAVPGADGTLHLHAAENAALDTRLRESVVAAALLHDDLDEDGILDPEDLALPVLLHGTH